MTAFKERLEAHDERARRMSHWSWWMLPVSAVAYVVTSIAYEPVLTVRGQHEGDLFAMTEDVAGVALELGFALVLVAAPVLGVVLAIRALRREPSRSAWATLLLNGVLVLLVLYQFADALRMAFFAPLD